MVWPFFGTLTGREYTAHDADAPLPASVQCLALKTPRPLLEKLTVPAGVVALPGEISLTVAVHLSRADDLTCLQVRAVLVARSVTVRAAWPLLAAWLLSPP